MAEGVVHFVEFGGGGEIMVPHTYVETLEGMESGRGVEVLQAGGETAVVGAYIEEIHGAVELVVRAPDGVETFHLLVLHKVYGSAGGDGKVLDTTWTHLFDTIPVYDTTHVSIQGAEAMPWKIGQSGLNIIVSGAEGETVRVYDVSGRCLHVQPRAVGVLRFRMPTAGVYLVQVGGSPAQRVVITDVGS